MPQRFSASLDLEKINAATLDVIYAPTNGMNVLEYNGRGYSMVAQIGQGSRKIALAGNSTMFHYGPRLQQLADEGRLPNWHRAELEIWRAISRADAYWKIRRSCDHQVCRRKMGAGRPGIDRLRSRPEAIRRLVEIGLYAKRGKP